MLSNEADLSTLHNAISNDLSKYKKKGFEIKKKNKTLTDDDIIKLFKLKFRMKNVEINYIESDKCVYYIADQSEYKNDKLYTERNIIFFTK